MDPATVQALRDTKQLLDDGIITEADFEAKKAELLGQPAAEPPAAEPEPPVDPEEALRQQYRAGGELTAHNEQNAYYEGENAQIEQENAQLDAEIAQKSQRSRN